MIFDGFPFFNELDLLEIRLNELDGLVDRFILVESNLTHSGKPKPMWFRDNKHLFERFLPKITHIEVLDMPVTDDPWVREIHQRNAMMRGIPKDAPGSDLLISGDVDEIPRRLAITKHLPITAMQSLDMSCYHMFLNADVGRWKLPTIGPVGAYRASTPRQVRQLSGNGSFFPPIPNAGWHFGWVGGVDRMAAKFAAFAHQEEPVQLLSNLDNIRTKFRAGMKLWDTATQMAFKDVDDSFPEYVVQNVGKFRHMIGIPDGPNSVRLA
jgi:beta-1,4-mannosyl-glycoprotein beta-1,4-N-acetylglucosaminyltransferase